MCIYGSILTPKTCICGSILTPKNPLKFVYMVVFLPQKKTLNVYIWPHFYHQKTRIFSPAAGCIKNVYIYGTILTPQKTKICFVCGGLCKKYVYIWHFEPQKKQKCFRLQLCKKSRILSKNFRLRRSKTNDAISITKHV
jgi:hypothetical protein